MQLRSLFTAAGILVFAASAIFAAPGQQVAQAQTSSCFGSDQGASSLDRNAHYAWAQQRDSTLVMNNLQWKIGAVFNCSSSSGDRLAAGFGQMSGIIADYVQNPACFNNDSGVTIRDRAAHEAWARTKTRTQVRDNLLWKTGAAMRCVDRPNLVALFADMSAVLARVPESSGGGAGTSSGGGPTNGSFSASVGRWSWSGTCSGSVYTGSFTIANVNPDGTFGGAFQQNGTASYDGTIAGRIQSGRVSFTRRWGGPDQQQWDGTLDQTRMAGTIAGFGAPCTFTASKQ